MSNQNEIDASNLRLYRSLFLEHKWQTDQLHWSVFAATLGEIASRILGSESDHSAKVAELEAKFNQKQRYASQLAADVAELSAELAAARYTAK